MFEFVKMKSLRTILAALLFLQMTPAYALAQQNKGKPQTSAPAPSTAKPATTQKPATLEPVEAAKPTPPPAEDDSPINVGGRTPDGWPIFGDGFMFEWKNPGANPAIPLDLVPGYGKGTEAEDKEILRSMILGEKGFEEASRLHDLTIKLSLYDGLEDPDVFFQNDLKLIASNMKFTKIMIREDMIFQSRMPQGYVDRRGNRSVKLTERAAIAKFKEPMVAYQTDAIFGRGGLFKGLTYALVYPRDCTNVLVIAATKVLSDKTVEPVTLPGPTLAKIKVNKKWKTIDGKKADTPKRTDVQLRYEFKPADGGPSVFAEAYDNENAEVLLEVGKYYTRIEHFNSDAWRPEQPDSSPFQVGHKNKDQTVVNIKRVFKPEATAAAACTGDCLKGEKGDKGDRGPKGDDGGWPLLAKIGLGAAIAGAGLGIACKAHVGNMCRSTVYNVMAPGKSK